MITRKWPKWFLESIEYLPDDYLVFDIETTGFDRKVDVITQIGHCLVQDRKVVSELEIILDWRNHPILPHPWFLDRLAQVQQSVFNNTDSKYPVTLENMAEEGINPEEGMEFYHDLLVKFRDSGMFIVGHNILGFDEAMMEANFAGFGVATEFCLGQHVIDTESIGIAIGMEQNNHPKAYPLSGETPREYFKRMKGFRGGLKLKNKLEDMVKRYGIETDLARTHSALFDSQLTHMVLEKIRNDIPDPGSTALNVTFADPEPTKKQVPVKSNTPVRRRGQRNS